MKKIFSKINKYPFSFLIPGLGNILQGRIITGLVFFFIFISISYVSSIISGTPEFPKILIINPIFLIIINIFYFKKNIFTSGFIIYTIVIFLNLIIIVLESYLWERNKDPLV